MYEAINTTVLNCVPNSAKRILDIGCGSGSLGKQIKLKLACEVVGITHSEKEAEFAANSLDHVLVKDLNNFDSTALDQYDCIICSHILEHLYQPDKFLHNVMGNLAVNGVLIIALPNILHWKQRLEFLKGDFKYTDGGLMDRTHFRFFDWDTAFDLVQNSGFRVISREADGYFPLPGIRKLIKPFALTIDRAATRVMPGLLGTQFIIVAQAA